MVSHEATEESDPRQFDVKNFSPPRGDAGWNLEAAKGIETASKDFGPPGRPYNVAVLPAARGDLYIYLYPAQVEEGVYPLGADVRYLLSADGVRILEKRQMHKAIIESRSAGKAGVGESGYHTHVLSSIPEDTDVMLVLSREPRVPEIVIAGSHTFMISVTGKITVVERPK